MKIKFKKYEQNKIEQNFIKTYEATADVIKSLLKIFYYLP